MRAIVATLALGLALSASPQMPAQAEDMPPPWAYARNPDFKPAPDDGAARHVPDSTAAFTVTQARDLFAALDWHPADHPPLPDIVAHGRKPDVMACGVCHRADGPAVRRMPASLVCQRNISCSRWRTSKAGRGRPRCRSGTRPS